MNLRVPEVPGRARVLLPANALREEWLKVRRIGIGSSDAAALVGANPYSTPFDVWRSKVDGWEPPVDRDNAAMEWGRRLEGAVIEKAAEELGLVARTGGGLWQSLDHEILLATPDAIVTRNRSWKAVGIVEAKTAGDNNGWENGDAPIPYRAQLIWQLGILGLERGWLACLELGRARSFYLVEVPFDRKWFAEILNEAETFWSRHVLSGEPPLHDVTHPRTAELLKEMYPKATTPSVELDDDALDWARQYHAVKAEADAATARLEEIRNFIRLQLGDAGAGYVGDKKVFGYGEVASSGVDTNLLRAKYPEIVDEVTVTSTHRRLTVAK